MKVNFKVCSYPVREECRIAFGLFWVVLKGVLNQDSTKSVLKKNLLNLSYSIISTKILKCVKTLRLCWSLLVLML